MCEYMIPRKLIKNIYQIIADPDVRTLNDFYEKVYCIDNIHEKIILENINNASNVIKKVPGISNMEDLYIDKYKITTAVDMDMTFTPAQLIMKNEFEEKFYEFKQSVIPISKPKKIDTPVDNFCDKYSNVNMLSIIYDLLELYVPNIKVGDYIKKSIYERTSANNNLIADLDNKIESKKRVIKYLKRHSDNLPKCTNKLKQIEYKGKITISSIIEIVIPNLEKNINKMNKNRDYYIGDNVISFYILDNYSMFSEEIESLFANPSANSWIESRNNYIYDMDLYSQRIDTIATKIRKYGIIVNSTTICDPTRCNYVVQYVDI